jgi:hypothetical protein
MDGIGREIVIGVICNIICSALAFVGATAYKNYKKRTAPTQFTIIGWLSTTIFTTVGFLVSFFLLPLLIPLSGPRIRNIETSFLRIWSSMFFGLMFPFVFRDLIAGYFRDSGKIVASNHWSKQIAPPPMVRWGFVALVVTFPLGMLLLLWQRSW